MRHLLTFTLGLLLSGVAMLASAGEAGRIVFVTGQAQLSSRPAATDAAVQEGDELSTGADGYLYLKTIDSGFLILRPNSRARVVMYHIDQANPANTRVKLELLSGVARSISGVGVKQARQNFRFNTPVAAIGVRGTDFVVFTDQQTSRVTVVSGGVVVSGFAGGCGPDGSGPCEGGNSRELFAGQAGALLQIERGQKIPQLLHNATLSPDQNAAPRSDEPVGKASGAGALPGADLSLDAQKAQKITVLLPNNLNGGGAGGTDSTNVKPPPVVVIDPPVTPPSPPVVPVARSAPEVFWGRWETVADRPPEAATLARLASNDITSDRVFLGSYVMGRLKDATFVMPQDGTGVFSLASSEAVMQRSGQADAIAKVDNARLGVDFAARTFNTSLSVSAQGQTIQVNGAGDVTNRGMLQSNGASESVIRGFLGGAHAEEAGYLFLNSGTPGITVQGATKWTR